MTSERDNFDGGERVSEVYRELGAEKTPESLNQRILEMSTRSGSRSGARNMLSGIWMKPLAWAATIGLSLAIVLEFTELPTTAIPYDTVPQAESIPEEVVIRDTDRLQEIEHRDLEQPGANRSAIIKDEVTDDVEVFRREAIGKIDSVAAPAQMPSSAPVPSPASVDQIPHDLQDTARKRVVESSAPDESMASFAVMAEEKEADTAESCSAEVRLSAENWLTCIDNLRQSGATEAADREFEAFILEYPSETGILEPNK